MLGLEILSRNPNQFSTPPFDRQGTPITRLAQTKANQQNAKKLSGPKTPVGKARVSKNVLTHGTYAAIPLLPGENQDKLSQLADDINAALNPTDTMEVSIVERIIIGTIRQIRLREA